MRVWSAGFAGGVVLALTVAPGCFTPGRPEKVSPPTPDAHLFAPLVVPPDFDRERAMLPLARIPDDPPAPPAGELEMAPELVRPAARHLAEARRLFAEHRYTETILTLEKALSYEPHSHEGHRMMALACLLSGSNARAKLSAHRALTIKPDDLPCHYVLGRLADKAGKTSEALRAYRMALKCKATEPDASYRALTHYRLGVLLDQERYYRAAIEQLEAFESDLQGLGKKVDENPELASIARIHRGAAAIRVARAYGMLENYPAAADALKTAIAHLPKDLELRGEYVRMLVRAGRIEEAAAEARRFVADSNGCAEAVQLLLAVHRHAGRPQAGVAAMKEIIAQQPDNIELWLLYADALVAARQSAEAVETLDHLITEHPTASAARWKLIELYRSRKDWPAWLAALAEELAVQPADYVRAAQELDRVPAATARRIVQEGLDATGAEKELIPPVGPNDKVAAGLDYLLGGLCDRLDRVDDARRFFERSLEQSPGFLPGTLGAAELYVHRCRWNDAITVIQAARERRQEPAHQLERLLGQCYDGLDELEEAVAHYEEAIRLNRADVRSMMLLGQLHERQGERQKARRQYQAAIAADPDHMLAREAYIRNLLASGDESGRALGRVSLEFAEMQRRAGEHPATIRCSALLKFLRDRDRDAYGQTLRNLIQAHPDDLRSRVELATTLVAFRDYEEARLEAAEILARDPRSAPGGELMAVVLTKLLDFEQAAKQYQRILSWYPNRAGWIRSFAELRLIEQDYEAAIELWERLLSLPGEAGLQERIDRGRLMEAYRLAERFDEARRVAAGWLEETGSDDPAYKLGQWFLLAADQAEHNDDQYIQRCRRWLEADPDDRDIRSWLIGVSMDFAFPASGRFQGRGGLIGAGRFDEALVQVLEWLADAPGDASFIKWQVDVLQAARRWDEAIELARNLSATEGRAYILQALYARARRYDEAIEAEKAGIATAQQLLSRVDPAARPEFEAALFDQRRRIGSLLSQAGRFDDAIAHLNKMIEETDNRHGKADLLRTLAYVHQRRNRPDLAEQRLREAYRLAPTDIGLNNDLGYTLAEAGKDLAEAERMIRLAVAEAPRQPAYLDSLGWVLYKRGRLADARTWLTRAAAQKEGEDPVIFDHLGDVQWRLDAGAEAIRSWRRALEIYERQWADGQTETNEQFVAQVNGKLEAAASGKTPAVAPIAGDETSNEK